MLRRPSQASLQALHATAQRHSPANDALGASLGELRAGFERLGYADRVGDEVAFEAAADAVLGWEAHRGAGLEVYPQLPAEAGATVLLVGRIVPLWFVAPCRVTEVIHEEGRRGLVYATLPGHPECGEEAFLVTRRDGETVFEATATSRPATALLRLAGPLARTVEDVMTRRYVRSFARDLAA